MNPEKFHEFGELIPFKGRNLVENCQPTKNLLESLVHPFGESLAHLFFFGSLAHLFHLFFVAFFKEILKLFI